MIYGYTFTHLHYLLSCLMAVVFIRNHTVTSLPLSGLLYILLTRSSASCNNNLKETQDLFPQPADKSQLVPSIYT